MGIRKEVIKESVTTLRLTKMEKVDLWRYAKQYGFTNLSNFIRTCIEYAIKKEFK